MSDSARAIVNDLAKRYTDSTIDDADLLALIDRARTLADKRVIRLQDPRVVYVRSMGKALRVTAIACTAEDANAYCATHRDEGVIADWGGLIFIANLYDQGTWIGD